MRSVRLQEGWKDGRMENVAIQRLHLLKQEAPNENC